MKAAILLSTYNGEKYISEQLDSIVSQTYSDLELYVRDDGSTDRTPDILQEYEKQYNWIHVVDGNHINLGYPACFYSLTDMDIDAEWFFFADQDDYWMPEKISSAMKMLEKYSSEDIVAYYSRYYVCDENLKEIKVSPEFPSNRMSLQNVLYDVLGLEFTMAISRGAKDCLNAHKPVSSDGRGTWMSMLFASQGEIVFDNGIYAKYRRHGSAVTNSDNSFIGLWLWRIKHFFSGNGFEKYTVLLEDFYSVMVRELNKEERKMLELFLSDRRMHKTFYPNRLRKSFLDELALRIMFFVGKL